MRIRVLGAGWYGSHLATALLRDGHSVEVHESKDRIFAGASGSIPARLHLGFHYPRSKITRAACQDHSEAFMAEYGHLTHGVPINIYAVAKDHSLVDFDQYRHTLQGEVEFVTIHDPAEYGLCNVEGALLTGERHILTNKAKTYFERELEGHVHFNQTPGLLDDPNYDWTIDCTFCANESSGVDRYEPCLVLMMAGETDTAVTIMDGPFGSLYPWDEEEGLCSLSSALWTPFSKTIRRYEDALAVLANVTAKEINERAEQMIDQMATFYPAIDFYRHVDTKLSIRAMPLSGADTRLVDVVKLGPRVLRVRAGKIDAVLHAEKLVRSMIE
jgi:hypothetical protein